MFTSFAFIVVIICTILFFLFYLISVVFFQESYYINKINITNIQATWDVLNDCANYHTWWKKFSSIKEGELSNKIIINSSIDKNKLSFNLDSHNFIEKWCFYLQKAGDKSILVIKVELSTDSILGRFYFKYIKSKKEIKKLIIDLNNYNLIRSSTN
jgi:hypothetical protein